VTSILKIANQPGLNAWMREKEFRAIREHLSEACGEASGQHVTPELIDAALEKGRATSTVV
jgi:hypothetical protein